MIGIDGAIKKTRVYIKKYGGFLSVEELCDRLIGSTVFSKNVILREAKRMGVKMGKKNNLLEKKKKIAAKKVAMAIAKNDNDVIFLGLTGSVAAGNCKKNDDIDLMVVTRKNCLWKCRLRLKLFLKKNGISNRKYGEAEEENAFCFNMCLDEDALRLPKEKQTLRSAVDLILMKPLFDRDNVYEKFIKINGWAKRRVATPYENLKLDKLDAKLFVKKERKRKEMEKGMINLMAFVLQYLYMWPKVEKEKVGLKSAFFHQG